MDVINALLNTVVVVLIVSTMFGAGLGTTLGALGATFRNVKLVLLVLVANLVLVPLIGWATAAVLSIDTPAYVALVLLACSPGAPFAAKLAMIQRGDVVTGASLQVFLAAIGSLTFAPTANAIFTAAKLGGGISLPVFLLRPARMPYGRCSFPEPFLRTLESGGQRGTGGGGI